MTAILTDKTALASARDRIIDMAHSAHAEVVKTAQEFSSLIRSGEPAAPDLTQARQAALADVTGLERVRIARHIDLMWPDAKAYDSARSRFLTSQRSPGVLAAQPPASTDAPPPAITVRSTWAPIEAAAKAAGVIFAEQAAELLANAGGYVEPQRVAWTHAGRTYVAMVSKVLPYRGIYQIVEQMVRVALVDSEAGENAAAVDKTIARVREALLNRDVHDADRAIRAIGSPDGFDTKLVGA